MQALELGAGIPHVAPHGRVRPRSLGVAEEAQVQLDQPGDGGDRVGVEPQGLQALSRETRALDVVVVERHPAAGLEATRRGLADVVQQRRETQWHVGRGIRNRSRSSSIACRSTVSECS